MPKPSRDTLLSTVAKPAAPAAKEKYERRRAIHRSVTEAGAKEWNVDVLPYSERHVPQPGSGRIIEPWVEVSFTVVQFEDGQLAISGWSISGGSDVRLTTESRFPLRTWGRAAILAVVDALESAGYTTYEQVIDERRVFTSAYEITNGRLEEWHTRRPSIATERTRAYATDSSQRLEPADVAAQYRQAVERGSRSPTVDVAHAFNIGRSTAARKLAEARKLGLLGPALRNRAGEARDRNGSG